MADTEDEDNEFTLTARLVAKTTRWDVPLWGWQLGAIMSREDWYALARKRGWVKDRR